MQSGYIFEYFSKNIAISIISMHRNDEVLLYTKKKYRYCGLDYLKPIQISRHSTQYTYIYFINHSDGPWPFLQLYLNSSTTKHNSSILRGVIVEEDDYIDKKYHIFFESMKPLLGETCIISDEIIRNLQITTEPQKKNTMHEFLLRHPYCMHIQDETGKVVPMPVIGYRQRCTLYNNVAMLGNQDDIVGPYYYFYTTTTTTNKKLCKCNNSNCDLIRFALFLGRLKVPMNFPKDKIDESLMKKQLLRENEKDVKQTMRISDHDGIWTRDYDSVYMGTLELDDGQKMANSCWVVKSFTQYSVIL